MCLNYSYGYIKDVKIKLQTYRQRLGPGFAAGWNDLGERVPDRGSLAHLNFQTGSRFQTKRTKEDPLLQRN